jgi:hypothetical protein
MASAHQSTAPYSTNTHTNKETKKPRSAYSIKGASDHDDFDNASSYGNSATHSHTFRDTEIEEN